MSTPLASRAQRMAGGEGGVGVEQIRDAALVSRPARSREPLRSIGELVGDEGEPLVAGLFGTAS